jgi:hypothetical protein
MVMPVAGDTEMSVLESLVWNLEKTDPDEAMKGELMSCLITGTIAR